MERLSQVFSYIALRRIEVGVFLTSLLSSFSVFLLSALRFPNDDQFILFRYIDNIAGGEGFVFNLGERVLGSTTPLFTLLASLLKTIIPVVQTPDLVACLNIGLLAVSAVFFYRLCRLFLSEGLAALAAVIFALNLSRTIPEGMETPLFLLTAFALLYYLLSDRFALAAVFLALAVLTRPDAGLIAILVGVYWIQRRGMGEALRLTVLSLAVAAPWFLFALFYFGSFIPQSLLTKLHSSDIYNLHPLQAIKIQLASLSRIYWGRIFDPEHIPLQVIFNLLPFLTLASIGARELLRRGAWILVAIPLAYLLSFSISNPIIFPWYVSQMEPLWILLSVCGLGALLQSVPFRPVRIICIAFILAGPLFFFGSLVLSEERGTKLGAFEFGTYIKEHIQSGERVGVADIGIIGYVTKAPIVDFIGLVTPESVRFYPIDEKCTDRSRLYIIPPRLIEETRPEWLVASEDQLSSCSLESEWFTTSYEKVHERGSAAIWKFRGGERNSR